MKYKKKPIVIEAVKWDGKNHREMCNFLIGKADDYISANGDNFYIDHETVNGGLIIKTLEGEHIANIGDYIYTNDEIRELKEMGEKIMTIYGGCHSKNKQKPCCRAINTNGSNRR